MPGYWEVGLLAEKVKRYTKLQVKYTLYVYLFFWLVLILINNKF